MLLISIITFLIMLSILILIIKDIQFHRNLIMGLVVVALILMILNILF